MEELMAALVGTKGHTSYATRTNVSEVLGVSGNRKEERGGVGWL